MVSARLLLHSAQPKRATVDKGTAHYETPLITATFKLLTHSPPIIYALPHFRPTLALVVTLKVEGEPRAQSQPDRRRFHRRCSSRGTRVAMPHQTNPIRGGADLLVCVLPAFPKKTKRTQSRLQRSATHRSARSRTPAPNKPILRTTKTKGTTCTVHQTNPIVPRLPSHAPRPQRSL
jgi:hypothetical protein